MKSAIISLATKQVMKWLISKASFLSWGPLSFVVSALVKKVVTVIVEETVLGVKILKIENQVNTEVFEVNETVKKIKDVKTSEDERLKLDEKLERDIIALIRAYCMQHY